MCHVLLVVMDFIVGGPVRAVAIRMVPAPVFIPVLSNGGCDRDCVAGEERLAICRVGIAIDATVSVCVSVTIVGLELQLLIRLQRGVTGTQVWQRSGGHSWWWWWYWWRCREVSRRTVSLAIPERGVVIHRPSIRCLGRDSKSCGPLQTRPAYPGVGAWLINQLRGCRGHIFLPAKTS